MLGRPAYKDYRFLRGLVRDHGIGEIAEVASRLEREAGERVLSQGAFLGTDA
jgi:hypothetical protein